MTPLQWGSQMITESRSFFKSTNDIIKQKYLSGTMYPVHQVKCPVEART